MRFGIYLFLVGLMTLLIVATAFCLQCPPMGSAQSSLGPSYIALQMLVLCKKVSKAMIATYGNERSDPLQAKHLLVILRSML